MTGAWASRGVLLVAVTCLLVAACAAPASSLAPSESPAGTPRPSPPPDFAFGSWTMTLTEADWIDAGFEAGELVKQNAGAFVLDFADDGTWRSVQTSLIGVALVEPVFRGKYTVSGDTLRMETDFPEHYRTEGVYVDVIQWRLDGDELHLDLIEQGDEFTAVIYGTKVWRRP